MSAAERYLEADHADAAVRALEPLATRSDASPAMLALYGRALLAAGNVQRASNTYAQAIERDPAQPEALFGRAEMAVRSHRGRDALNLLSRLQRALEGNPRPRAFRARMQLLRGRALEFVGRAAEGRQLLRQLVESGTAPRDAFFHYAESEVGHNHRAARDAYLHYLELAPNGFYARRCRMALGIHAESGEARQSPSSTE